MNCGAGSDEREGGMSEVYDAGQIDLEADLKEMRRQRRLRVIRNLRETARQIRKGAVNLDVQSPKRIRLANAADDMDALADLLRVHGHQGGYPNLRIPNEERVVPMFRPEVPWASYIGSSAMMCADKGAH